MDKQTIFGTCPSKSNCYVIYKGNTICSLEYLIINYKELKSVWKVATELNISGQIVHKYLKKSSAINKMNYFTNNDLLFLKEYYLEYRNKGQLGELAAIMGRTKPFISRKAKLLQLTDKNNHISMKYMAKEISERTKNQILKKGHPKGMLGKKHTNDFKEKCSIRVKEIWNDCNSKFNSQDFKQKQSDRMSIFMNNKIKNNSVNNYNRVKRGFIEIGGKKFFARSSWEANIAAYLEFLKTNLEIKEWQHEPETFWFEKIKRGVRSYLPDFKITKNDETIYFLEVKGWMDDKSKTKIKRMALYYPNVTLDIIDQKRYKDIKRSSSVIKNWGLLDSDEFLNKIKVCSVEGCELKNFCKNYCRKHYYENTKVVFKKN